MVLGSNTFNNSFNFGRKKSKMFHCSFATFNLKEKSAFFLLLDTASLISFYTDRIRVIKV